MADNKKSFDVAIEKVRHAQKLRPFRPQNMSNAQLAASPDLDYIRGEFSTFDSNLSDMQRARATSDEICNYIHGHIAADGWAAFSDTITEYARFIWYLRNRYDDFAHAAMVAGVDGDVNAWRVYFEKMLVDLNAVFKPDNAFVDIRVIDSWSDAGCDPEQYKYSGAITDIQKRPDGPRSTHCMITINRAVVANVVRLNKYNAQAMLAEMTASFAHEYMHCIDAFASNRGALGAQFVNAADKVYVSAHENISDYKYNPEEAAAEFAEEMILKLFNNFAR